MPKDINKIVYTYGAFDLLHPGHIKVLESAKGLGDILIVGVVSDEAIKERKGNDRPIQPLRDRIRIVKALEMVDIVIGQMSYNPIKEMNEMPHISILTKGDDYDHLLKVSQDYGCRFIKLPYSQEYSTTDLVGRIRNDNIK